MNLWNPRHFGCCPQHLIAHRCGHQYLVEQLRQKVEEIDPRQMDDGAGVGLAG